VYDEGYSSTLATIFPTYLTTELAADGGAKAFNEGSHQYWARWDAAATDDFIRLIQHFGNLLDSEPDVEMFRAGVETSIGGDRYATAGETAYRTQLQRQGAAIRTYWPTTLGWLPFNWEPYSSMGTSMATASAQGVGFGAPDTVPVVGDPNYQRSDLFILGELGGHDYRNEIPIIKGAEDSEMGVGSVGAAGGYTAQQIFDYCNDTLRASHIFWPRNVSFGTNDQRWYDSGTTNPGGILDVIASETFTYTLRRTNWT
jgi:hypothetical protein